MAQFIGLIARTLGLLEPPNIDAKRELFSVFADVLGIEGFNPNGASDDQLFERLGVNVPRTDAEAIEFAQFMTLARQRSQESNEVEDELMNENQDNEEEEEEEKKRVAEGDQKFVVTPTELKKYGLSDVKDATELLKMASKFRNLARNCVTDSIRNSNGRQDDEKLMEIVCKHGRRAMQLGDWKDEDTSSMFSSIEGVFRMIRDATEIPDAVKNSRLAIWRLVSECVSSRIALLSVFPVDEKIREFVRLVKNQADQRLGLFEGKREFNDDMAFLLDLFRLMSPERDRYRDVADKLRKLQAISRANRSSIPQSMRATDEELLEIACGYGRRLLQQVLWDKTGAEGVLTDLEELARLVGTPVMTLDAKMKQAIKFVRSRMGLLDVFPYGNADENVAEFVQLVKKQRDSGQGLFQYASFNMDFKILLEVFRLLSPGPVIYARIQEDAKKLNEAMKKVEVKTIDDYINFVSGNQPMAVDPQGKVFNAIKVNNFNPATIVPLLEKLSAAGIRSADNVEKLEQRIRDHVVFARLSCEVAMRFVQQSQTMVDMAYRSVGAEREMIRSMVEKLGPDGPRAAFAERKARADAEVNLESLTRLLDSQDFRSFETGMALLSQAIKPVAEESIFTKWFTQVQKLCVTIFSPNFVSGGIVGQTSMALSASFDPVVRQLESLIQNMGEVKLGILQGAADIVDRRVQSLSRTVASVILQYQTANSKQESEIKSRLEQVSADAMYNAISPTINRRSEQALFERKLSAAAETLRSVLSQQSNRVLQTLNELREPCQEFVKLKDDLFLAYQKVEDVNIQARNFLESVLQVRMNSVADKTVAALAKNGVNVTKEAIMKKVNLVPTDEMVSKLLSVLDFKLPKVPDPCDSYAELVQNGLEMDVKEYIDRSIGRWREQKQVDLSGQIDAKQTAQGAYVLISKISEFALRLSEFDVPKQARELISAMMMQNEEAFEKGVGEIIDEMSKADGKDPERIVKAFNDTFTVEFVRQTAIEANAIAEDQVNALFKGVPAAIALVKKYATRLSGDAYRQKVNEVLLRASQRFDLVEARRMAKSASDSVQVADLKQPLPLPGEAVDIIKKAVLFDNKEVIETLQRGIASLIVEKKDGKDQILINELERRLYAEQEKQRRALQFIERIAAVVNTIINASIGEEKKGVPIDGRALMDNSDNAVTVFGALENASAKVLAVQQMQRFYAGGTPIEKFVADYANDKKLLDSSIRDIEKLMAAFGVNTSVADRSIKLDMLVERANTIRRESEACQKLMHEINELYIFMQKGVVEEKKRQDTPPLTSYAKEVEYIIKVIRSVYTSRKEFEEALDSMAKSVTNFKYRQLISEVKIASRPGASEAERKGFKDIMTRADYMGPEKAIVDIPDPNDLVFTSWNEKTPRDISFFSFYEFMEKMAGPCGMLLDALMFSPAINIKLSSTTWKFIGIQDDVAPRDPFPVAPRNSLEPVQSEEKMTTGKGPHIKGRMQDRAEIRAYDYLFQRYGNLIDDDDDDMLDLETRRKLRFVALKAMNRIKELCNGDYSKYRYAIQHYLKPHAYSAIIQSANILLQSENSPFHGVNLHEMMHSPVLGDHFAVLCAVQLKLTMVKAPGRVFHRQLYETLVLESNGSVSFLLQAKRNGPYNWVI